MGADAERRSLARAGDSRQAALSLAILAAWPHGEHGGDTMARYAGGTIARNRPPGWSLAQRTPGEFTWATPTGRRYRTGPASYRG